MKAFKLLALPMLVVLLLSCNFLPKKDRGLAIIVFDSPIEEDTLSAAGTTLKDKQDWCKHLNYTYHVGNHIFYEE